MEPEFNSGVIEQFLDTIVIFNETTCTLFKILVEVGDTVTE